ncbi:unnamed protein product [Symbiodinium necroappetens]|uniref:Uncharacterized protein n=1 Tax=Symbiodinium necroappetens TaxID=1628268 RepID=A0A812XJX6_9DINO|nr:unnamed protein product [Symbiodinium necroappetens]
MDSDCVVGLHLSSTVVRDPYIHPAAHEGTCAAFFLVGIGMWLTALVLRFAPVSASPKLRKALTAACLLRGIGYLLEGVAHVAFNQRDGLALALGGRAVVVVSLFFWLTLATGLAEVVWEGMHILWLTSWLMSFLFLPGVLSCLFLFSQHSTTVAMSAAGVVDFYWACMWAGVARTSWIRGGVANGPAAGMLVLAASGSFFQAATENLCGPPAHADCYKDCFMNGGGWHSFMGSSLCLLGHLFFVGFWLLDAVPMDVQWPPKAWEHFIGSKAGDSQGEVEPATLPPGAD